MIKEEIKITNSDYFFMIDNQVRSSMQRFETQACLPAAKKLLEKSNISINELRDYPVEGYYYETPELKLYFTIIRNLQHNEPLYERIVKCEELEFLQIKCDNDIFGIVDPCGRNNNSLVKRRYDILTLTMENPTVFPDMNSTPRPWSIDRIMKGLGTMYKNRTNLVELAYLVNDPKCLCCGAETNSLNRMIACVSGSCSITSILTPLYIWTVDPEVEALGKRLVLAYNNLISKDCIVSPTIENHMEFKKSPKVPRVALLGYVTGTREYYHWILTNFNQLKEVYSTNVITTESYTKQFLSGYSGNIFNAIPV
jgi:hypothetical protein